MTDNDFIDKIEKMDLTPKQMIQHGVALISMGVESFSDHKTALKCACEISDKASSYILSGISKTMEKKFNKFSRGNKHAE